MEFLPLRFVHLLAAILERRRLPGRRRHIAAAARSVVEKYYFFDMIVGRYRSMFDKLGSEGCGRKRFWGRT
jgi:hypothetical protein